MAQPPEVRVKVIRAHDIKNTGWFHHLKPYAVVWIDGGAKKTTRVRSGDDPEWDEEFVLPLPAALSRPEDAVLHVDVVDNGETTRLVGSATLPLRDVADAVHADGSAKTSLRLHVPNGGDHGKIDLRISYPVDSRSRGFGSSYPPPAQGYGQPAPYAAPPPSGYPYGAPPPQPYGQPAGYGGYQQPPPAYGGYQQPPPAYGGYPPAPVPAYGYGAPPPAVYGAPPPVYEAQPVQPQRQGLGMGAGLAIGAVGGLVGGLALEGIVDHVEDSIADRTAERVEEDNYNNYNDGYDNGYDNGYDAGFDNGYDDGGF